MDVGDVKVPDEDGLLSCSMMITAMNTIMKERLLTNRVAGQLCFSLCIQTGQIGFQPLHPGTGARLHDEPNLHLEFYRRTVTDGMLSPWHLLLMWSRKFPGGGYRKLRTWCSLLSGRVSIQVPSRTLTMKPGEHAPNCSVTNCGKYIELTLSSTGSTLHVYVKEEKWEVVYRIVIDVKKSETACGHFARTFPWRSRCGKECAKRIPTAPTHRQICGVNFLF